MITAHNKSNENKSFCNSNQLSSWVNSFFITVLIHFSKELEFPINSCIYAQAAVLKAITNMDAIAGKKLHDGKRNKPMSLAFIGNKLRLTFTGPDSLHYLEVLTQYLQTEPYLRLGDEIFEIKNIELGNSKSDRIQTWLDLCQSTQHFRLYFNFITPTAFTRQDKNNHRYMDLIPEPDRVFKPLMRRWQNLGGPTLPESLDDFLDTGGCIVVGGINNYHTESFSFNNQEQIGFMGNVKFLIRIPEPEHVQALNNLTRLAPFVGIGYQVARGMGAVYTKLED